MNHLSKPNFCLITSGIKTGASIKYLLNNLFGSWIKRYSHSSPALCIHIGDLLAIPAITSKAPPMPIYTAGVKIDLFCAIHISCLVSVRINNTISEFFSF